MFYDFGVYKNTVTTYLYAYLDKFSIVDITYQFRR